MFTMAESTVLSEVTGKTNPGSYVTPPAQAFGGCSFGEGIFWFSPLWIMGFSFCIPGDLLASFLCLFWEQAFLLEEAMEAVVSCGGLGVAGGICPLPGHPLPAALHHAPVSCGDTRGLVSPHTEAAVRSER